MGNNVRTNNHISHHQTEVHSIPNSKPKRQRKIKVQLPQTSTMYHLNMDFIFTWILIWGWLEGPTLIKILASLSTLCGCLYQTEGEE
jgi:hypothetical protein